MDPREVILAAIETTTGEYLDHTAEAIIAALSAAGMTICGEQAGRAWKANGVWLCSAFDAPLHASVPCFVPVLSDPQEAK